MKRASLLLAAAMTFAAAPASANGRYPESNHLVFSKSDPDLVLLRATFGLLVSHDRGHRFDWVCEQSIGFSGQEDPMYAVTPSGAFVGSTFQGVTVSRDKACSWAFVPGELDNQVFTDLAADPNDAAHIVAFSSSYDKQTEAGFQFMSKVFETRDEAKTWTLLSTLDPDILGHTIDLTTTDPDRIYITMVRDAGAAAHAFLMVSKDHGKTWKEESIALVGDERSLYIAGIDPKNAERVYIRTIGYPPDKPARLLLREATDGGTATVRTLYTGLGPLNGFALSADGSKVYVGGTKDGLQVASTDSFAFEKRSSIEIGCLAANGNDLWACSTEPSGFILGLSTDDGHQFEPRLHFCDIGQLACPAGTPTQDRCPQFWNLLRQNLGCEAPAEGGFIEAGVPPAPVPPPSSGKSCSCNVTPASPWGALVAALGACLAVLRRTRRLW